MADDSYKSIEVAAEGLFRDKGSRFIAYAFPFNSELEIKDILARLRSEHPKARHFCWAYRLTKDKNVYRINDDGEPSGSAGRPILNTLLSEELTNILVVVVRYFGGTLLGVPGLINAYKTATAEALNNCKVVTRTVNNNYLLSFPYLVINAVMKIIKEANLNVLCQRFDMNCELELEIAQSKVPEILLKLEHIDGLVCEFVGSR